MLLVLTVCMEDEPIHFAYVGYTAQSGMSNNFPEDIIA